jgi:hypothetical protein
LLLEHDGVNVTEPEEIQKIIYDYYKSFFGRHPGRGVQIGGCLGRQQEVVIRGQQLDDETFHKRRGERDSV